MEIKRGNTAIARKAHSKPYRHLLTKGIIKPGMDVLDYGCGRGYDVEALKNQGYNINGYDLYHEKYNDLDVVANGGRCFDLVTCNYVFNVIEDIEERNQLLDTLKGVCHGSIVIALRADKKAIKDTWKPYKDGYITPKGTFQKFYTLDDVQSFFNNSTRWDLKVLSANSNEIMIKLNDTVYMGK